MRRKLIKQKSAYTITLPVSWVREHHLTGKEELDVLVDRDKLVISASNIKTKKEVSLVLKKSTEQYYRIMIENHYLKGYDVLRVSFPKEDFSLVQSIVSNLIGFEIIDQHESSCVIAATANPEVSEFKTLFSRTLNIISYTGSLIKDDLASAHFSNFVSVDSQTKDVRRFMLCCTRLLHKESFVVREDESFAHLLLERLILLQHDFFYLYKKLSFEKKLVIKKEKIIFFSEVVDLFSLFKELLVKKDLSLLAKVHAAWEEKYFVTGPKLMANASKEENILLYHALHAAKLLFLLSQPSLVQLSLT